MLDEKEVQNWLNFFKPCYYKHQLKDGVKFMYKLENKAKGLTTGELKYLTKRVFRDFNKRTVNHKFVKFLADERVLNHSTYEYDYDYRVEWLLLRFDSVEEAYNFMCEYDADWVGEIDFVRREYDCTGETFSDGMNFTKIADNLIFAKKVYQLDV